MKRGEIIQTLRQVQAESANIRGWLDAVDLKVADLIERLSAPVEQSPPAQEAPRPAEGDPLAKTMADLVTPKQLGMIRALGRECGVDWEVECQAAMRCRTEELSRRAASAFIDHLKELQAQGVEFRRAV